MLDLSLLALDPPDHTRLRRLAAPAFTPERLAGYDTHRSRRPSPGGRERQTLQ